MLDLLLNEIRYLYEYVHANNEHKFSMMILFIVKKFSIILLSLSGSRSPFIFEQLKMKYKYSFTSFEILVNV